MLLVSLILILFVSGTKTEPDGLHSYLVLLFETHSSNILACGTILTRRWVTTQATPIIDRTVDSYVILTQPSNSHEIQTLLIHPDYEKGDLKTDLALIYLKNNLQFNVHLKSINLNFNDEPRLENCKIASLLPLNQKNIMLVHPTNSNENFYYFNEKPKILGAPLICDSVMIGLYIGGQNTSLAVRIDQGSNKNWLRYILSTPLLLKRNEKSNLVLKRCSNAQKSNKASYFLIITLIYFY